MSKPEIKEISLKKLVKAEYNPGEMLPSEFIKLKTSIKEFGDLEPIVFNTKTNVILDGHHRLDAYLEEDKDKMFALIRGDIGWIFSPDDIKVKDENHMKAMNIALRKIRGEFSPPKLENLITGLKEENFNMELTGFDDVEIDLMLNLDDDFGFNMGSGDSNDDDEPMVEGDKPGRSYSIHISFSSKEAANNFLENIGSDRKVKENSFTVLIDGDDEF